VDVADFDYALPAELIAQEPLPARDEARLLVLPRAAGRGELKHSSVRRLPQLLRAGDLLVVNDTRVVPARLRGHKVGSGGKVELLLVEPLPEESPSEESPSEESPSEESPSVKSPSVEPRAPREWLALGQAGKPLRDGAEVEVGGLRFLVVENRGGGELRLRLPEVLLQAGALWEFLEDRGELPLPPYLARAPSQADRDRYQTVFAKERGAVAAPTAGLHFTPRLLDDLSARGIRVASLTLHVGPGTFLPVRASRTEDHRMHAERYAVPPETVELHARTRQSGGRVVAVGTTSVRTLEAAWDDAAGRLRAGPGATSLFITPGYRFRAVDALFTNFHLPKSTLLMLVSAFAGLASIRLAYAEAVRERYRFFSYGDAMLVIE
jgi:S-adenosylmethionine:tRNA ribosyltransferase-isomerase